MKNMAAGHNPPGQLITNKRVLTAICGLLAFGLLIVTAPEASAQKLLRQIKRANRLEKAQRRNERQGSKLVSPQEETATEPARAVKNPVSEKTLQQNPVTLENHPLNGISERGIREIFSKDEREMIIPGFGRPPAFIFIMRQLYLTPQQTEGIKAIRRRVGNRLALLQREHGDVEAQLEEAIYGPDFDEKKVEALVEQSNQKQAEIARLRASIEADIRKLLSKDQLFVYRTMLSEMLLPRRAPALNPRQQQRRLLNQPGANQPNRPNPQRPPDGN